METRKFGLTDLHVSPLCLGTMQFGWTADEAAAFTVMDAFFAAGGNFLDTADVYSRWVPGNPGGVAETIIGRWMKARGNRDRIVVATKVRNRMWEGEDGEGLSRVHVLRAVEDSLRRLQIETIDLYQCHWPDAETPIEETLRTFEELIATGKVRYIGLSNYSAGGVRDALAVARKNSLPRVVSLQPRYSLVHRSEYEGPLAKLCEREGVTVIPYSPLGGGFLTGKYRSGEKLPDTPRAYQAKNYLTDEGMCVIDTLADIAEAHETTMAAAAVAWLLTKPAIAAPIIGANSVAQLAEILPAAELRLSAEEITTLDAASSTF